MKLIKIKSILKSSFIIKLNRYNNNAVKCFMCLTLY